jgi:hypothetical protein
MSSLGCRENKLQNLVLDLSDSALAKARRGYSRQSVIFQSPSQVLPGYKDILAPALFPVAIAAAERAYLRRSSSQIAAAKAERDD